MKGLFILYHYPPVNNANSIQNERFISSLNKNGVKTTVVIKGDKFIENEKIISIPSNSMRFSKAILRRTIPDLANIPDLERFFWTNKAKRKLVTLRDDIFNWVHTTSSPFSTHILGAKLKKKYNIPWVAQFYDPWVDNHYINFNFKFFKKLNLKYEAIVAKEADLILHSNNIIKNRWINRYGKEIAEKIVVLPFITDASIKASNKFYTNSKLTILHAGGIYGKRSLKELILALELLKKENENLENQIQITQIGHISKQEVELIRQKNLLNLFKFYEKKPYEQIVKELYRADILLLVDSLDTEENVFFPSKLVEYFSYNKLIIGITPINSPANTFLQEAGHIVIHKNENRQLKDFLSKILINGNLIKVNSDYFKNFLPDQICNEYLNALDNLDIIKDKPL